MEDRQTNYTIAEGVELPSKGLIYDKKIEPHIELRSLSGRDELKRQSPSSMPLKILADIIEGCMLEKPPIHVYDMCIGDYEYLLHRLRVTTYGNEYKMTVQCPHCGEYVDALADLDTLDVLEFDPAEYEELRNLTLPKSGKLVTLKIHTPRILDEIELKTKEMRRKYKDADIDFNTLATLMATIDTVDGVKLSVVDLEKFINKLPAADMIKILNTKDKLNSLIGLDASIIVDCPRCGEPISTFFRFGQEFFRPTNI